MKITCIERKGKKKVKVFIDYEFAFEGRDDILSDYSLEEGEDIDESVYECIKKEIIFPAAKKKAMDLLIRSDKSEYMLKNKLLESFGEEAADTAIEYVKSFGYVDDRRYVREYYLSHKDRHSLMQISYILRQNGVSKDDIEAALADLSRTESEVTTDADDPCGEYLIESELASARAFIKKKGVDSLSDLPYEEKGKMIAALKRKGYSTAVIRLL